MSSVPSAPDAIDFSARLHELRSIELGRLPRDARTVLHGGAAAAWYFRWFEENYSGTVDRHIGVEAFQERPADLPRNVDWLQRTLGDMGPVPTGSVDLVFGGQVIEHLWSDEVAAFLAESHRVLAPGGMIALDSPNRRVTDAIGWCHPQHTVEFSVDEIVQLTTLAGFALEEVRGVLLGYDRERHAYLGLEDESLPWEQRARLAADRPEDSFVWWVVGRRVDVGPDRERLRALAGERADAFRSRRMQQLSSPLPIQRETGRVPCVSAPPEYQGLLLQSLPCPLDAGDWCASLALRSDGPASPGTPVAEIVVTSESGAVQRSPRELSAGDLAPAGAWKTVGLSFNLPEMTMGTQLGASSLGGAAISAQMIVDLRRPDDVVARVDGATPSASTHIPEPRTLEILAMLRHRAVAKARAAIARR